MPAATRPSRPRAVTDCALAFALMHLGFRAVKKATPLGAWESQTGHQFTPGLVMIAVALLGSLLLRRSPADLGLVRADPRTDGAAAVTAWLPLVGLTAIGLACGAQVLGQPDSLTSAWGRVVVELLAAVATAWALPRTLRSAAFGRVGMALVFIFPAAVVLAGCTLGGDCDRALLTTAALLLGSGFGEELFFRGLLQSRFDEAFGRPWHLFGTRFGPGLLLASAAFGLVHLLNPIDYLAGTGSPAWGAGLATASTLSFGFLRARTGSIWPSAIAHGYANLAARLPVLLGA